MWRCSRSTSDADASTSERILAATAEVLSRNGMSKLSLSEVAVQAGVSRPTLYRWFASKEELLDAFGGWERHAFDSGISKATAGLRGNERLDAALRFIVDYQQSYSGVRMIDIEPGHVIGQMANVIPVMRERLERLISGPRAGGRCGDGHPGGGRALRRPQRRRGPVPRPAAPRRRHQAPRLISPKCAAMPASMSRCASTACRTVTPASGRGAAIRIRSVSSVPPLGGLERHHRVQVHPRELVRIGDRRLRCAGTDSRATYRMGSATGPSGMSVADRIRLHIAVGGVPDDRWTAPISPADARCAMLSRST